MDRIEKLEAEYPELEYEFDSDMPDHQGGLIYNHHVIINSKKTYQEQVGYLAEEIGHWETSTGDVVHAERTINGKEEHRARGWGYKKLISLDDLIKCYETNIADIDDFIDYFDVTGKYFSEVLEYYRQRHGIEFDYEGYRFELNSGFNMYPIADED